eukprot:GHUV01043763.1.p1 GENE.GHUV01043763.1~~GHUV01043763.1.p1  ORF type:complete len:110 (+),score=9.59 GHUV01043763.1:406-735(+)
MVYACLLNSQLASCKFSQCIARTHPRLLTTSIICLIPALSCTLPVSQRHTAAVALGDLRANQPWHLYQPSPIQGARWCKCGLGQLLEHPSVPSSRCQWLRTLSTIASAR